MKNIKYFKYNGTAEFWRFVGMKDAVAFRVVNIERYHGNILKIYSILFKDGNQKLFKVTSFKSLSECNKACLGYKGEKLLVWHKIANIREYKYKDSWDGKESYVITV